MAPRRKSAGVTTVTWSAARAIRDWTAMRIGLWPSEGPQEINGFIVVHRGRRYRVTVERD
jgi:hypothetical protein